MWEGYVSALEATQGVQAELTLNEVYAHLRNFEEILKQTDDPLHDPKH
jgi:hypothetical protein